MVTRAVTRVVKRSGNTLHYGLNMFLEFENLLYLKVTSYVTQF